MYAGCAGPPATILIVDDSAMNLQVLMRTLEGSGHRILAARDGPTALEIAKKAKPDLLLLDVTMPGMDGFEVLRRLKAQPETSQTMVIFLSARGEVSDKVSGLALGAIDYITKPIQGEEVLARVGVHLTRQHLERELRRSRDRLDRELAGAARMQRQLLPTAMPRHPALTFGTYYQTSRHAGGDYYDVLPLDGHRVGVFLADVSGHGAPAAIVMAMIRAVIHTYPGTPDDPPMVLRYINSHFEYLWDTEMYATAIYGVLDLARRTVRVSSAGHPLPLVVRRGQIESPHVDTTTPLLWHELDDVPSAEHPLMPGDRWVFFTDGITDRHAPDESMFDLDRLSAALGRHAHHPPQAIVDAIVSELEAFSRGTEADDDQTLLIVGCE